MANMRLSTMTIDQAIRHGGSELFVINNFVDRNSRAADVVGEYRDPNAPNSPPRPFKVPASWIPQRISDIAPKEAFLENSADFMAAVRRRWLVIVDPKQASEFLANNPDAQVEADHIQLIIQGNMAGIASIMSGSEGEEIDLGTVRNRNADAASAMAAMSQNAPIDGTPGDTPEQQVSPQVMDIMNRPPEAMSDQGKLNALRGLPQLTPAEQTYIHQHTSDPAILGWLNELSSPKFS